MNFHLSGINFRELSLSLGQKYLTKKLSSLISVPCSF